MKRYLKGVGKPPGTIIFTGEKKVDTPGVKYLEYNLTEITVEELSRDLVMDFHTETKRFIQWYDIRGIHDIQLIDRLGQLFKIHPLVREDVADAHQRPKYEEYDSGAVFILKALSFNKEEKAIHSDQVTLYFRDGVLLSFQEDADDLFSNVRKHLQIANSRIRSKQVDFLAYSLLDTIVDGYYKVLDGIEDYVEQLEESIMNNASENHKSQIHNLKQEMLVMRKAIVPLREAVNRLIKNENKLIVEETALFLRDLYDNVVQITDAIDTYRDILLGLQDLYMSEITFRMNNVMQVLTIITVIFIPLSFLAGIYGMNFINMPELQFANGYYVLLMVMVMIACLQIIYFRKKQWL